MRQDVFFHLFKKFNSWFFKHFMARRLIKSKTVQSRFSDTIYYSTINTTTFQMNFIIARNIKRLFTLIRAGS